MVQTKWIVAASLDASDRKMITRSLEKKNLTCLRCEESGHLLRNFQPRLPQNVDSALPTIEVYVCLMDSVCSRNIVSRKMCQTWKNNYFEVMTLGKTCISGVWQIELRVDRGTAEI